MILDHGQNAPVLVRAALLCAGCDIPAARKTCGLVLYYVSVREGTI